MFGIPFSFHLFSIYRRGTNKWYGGDSRLITWFRRGKVVFRLSLLITLMLVLAGVSTKVAAEITSVDSRFLENGEVEELASYMSQLQRYTHKLSLSAEANNTAATAFYLHE